MNDLLTVAEVLEVLRISRRTWQRLRRAGLAPRGVKVSPGCERWRRAELERWLERQGRNGRAAREVKTR